MEFSTFDFNEFSKINELNDLIEAELTQPLSEVRQYFDASVRRLRAPLLPGESSA